MKKPIALMLTFSLLLSSMAYAQFEKAPIQEQILDMIEDSGISEEISKPELVDLTFYVDQQGKVVLLDISGNNPSFTQKVKKSIQGLSLAVNEQEMNRTYKLSIDFELYN